MAEVVSKSWYVIRAVSGQEAKIKDYIMAEISRLGHAEQVEDILVPMEKVVQHGHMYESPLSIFRPKGELF